MHNIVEQLTRMLKEGKPINQNVADELLAKISGIQKATNQKSMKKETTKKLRLFLKVFLDEQAKSKSEIVDIERWFETIHWRYASLEGELTASTKKDPATRLWTIKQVKKPRL